jgi:DNA-binding XRE family transcriptional regulator
MRRNTKQKSAAVKTHAELVKSWIADPDFKAEYDALAEEYQLLREMLVARKRAGLTQAEVAEKMGTKAPAIARLESSHAHLKHSPSLNTLRQYAKAVGCRLEIHFKKGSLAKTSRSKHA